MCRGLRTRLHAYFRSDANENRYMPLAASANYMSGCSGGAVCVCVCESGVVLREMKEGKFLKSAGKR